MMKYKIEWSYKLKGNEAVLFSSDWIGTEVALRMGEELEKFAKAKDLIFYDEVGTSWTIKEFRKLLAEVEEEPHDLLIYFDGGYNKQTKKAGIGVVIFYQQGKKKYRIRANELIHEMNTNNEAEYAALHYGIQMLEEMGVQQMPCQIKGDSLVVLKQLEGEWPCYEEDLNRWLDRIEEKMSSLGMKPTYIPIPREENKEADQLARQALEGKMVHSKTQLL